MDYNKVLTDKQFCYNKAYGQNFIFDTNLLQAIVSDACITDSDTVVEIGTGAGTLTRQLCSAAGAVHSYEIDKRLESIHLTTLGDIPNLTMHYCDIMQVDVKELDALGKYKVVANLPYYITTPIIFKLLDSANIVSLTIMVQREVADRVVAKPGTADYGSLSVGVALRCSAKVLRYIGRDVFVPRPSVDSALIGLQVVDRQGVDIARVGKLVKVAFGMRRKTLVNNILAQYRHIDKARLHHIMDTMGLPQDVRGERLGLEHFLTLSRLLDEQALYNTK